MREDPKVTNAMYTHVHADVSQACHALANGAATAALSGHPSAPQLWFLVRALCHEHGMDLAGVTARAKQVAADRVERAQQS